MYCDVQSDANNAHTKGVELYVIGGSTTTLTSGLDMKVYSYQTGNYMYGASILSNPGSLTSGANIGVRSEAKNDLGNGYNYGVFTIASEGGTGTGQNYGMYSEATGVASTSVNYGVYSAATGGASNYGVYASAPTACTTSSTTSCTSVAGWFNGATLATANYLSSDSKLKTNVVNAQNTWTIINALQPKTYDYNSATFPSMNLPAGNHYGLIAQDVEEILPNLVKDLREPEKVDTLGNVIYPAVDFKAVNYTELIPIMIQAMKEQKATIDSLLATLNGSGERAANPQSTQKIELSDSKGIILNQNDPNPFTESTVIKYNVPSEVKSAKLMFSDNRGVILRTVIIEDRGEASLEVYASQLSSGIYTYTLICDGKVIESKKMLKTK